MDLYKKAAIEKWRFETLQGSVMVEDLFDLPLTSRRANLNDVAKSINKQIKDAGEEDFVSTSNNVTNVLREKLELVKDIITTKQAEIESRENELALIQRKQYLKSLITEKKGDIDKGKSLEDLEKELSSLN